VFSDDRFELDRLRDYDAQFHFRGKAVRVDDVPLDNVETNIVVERGVRRYDPVKVGIADGTVTLVGTLDANGNAPRLDMAGRPQSDLAASTPSRVATWQGGSLRRVCREGPSIAGMTRTADGEGVSCRRRGQLDRASADQPGFGGRRPTVVAGDRTATLYCAVSAFAIDDGLVRPRVLVIDTSRVRIDGEGTATREREVRAGAKAKSKCSASRVARPIVIGGSLRDPTAAVGGADRRACRVGGLAAVSLRSRSFPSSTWAARPTSTAGVCWARPTMPQCR
jgi:hypothetical protein